MNEIKISIAGVEYILKNSFASLLLFEEMTGRSVNNFNESVGDLLRLFYCILKAANRKTFLYSFEEFVDILDEEQDKIEIFSNFLNEQKKDIVKTNKKKAAGK